MSPPFSLGARRAPRSLPVAEAYPGSDQVTHPAVLGARGGAADRLDHQDRKIMTSHHRPAPLSRVSRLGKTSAAAPGEPFGAPAPWRPAPPCAAGSQPA